MKNFTSYDMFRPNLFLNSNMTYTKDILTLNLRFKPDEKYKIIHFTNLDDGNKKKSNFEKAKINTTLSYAGKYLVYEGYDKDPVN